VACLPRWRLQIPASVHPCSRASRPRMFPVACRAAVAARRRAAIHQPAVRRSAPSTAPTQTPSAMPSAIASADPSPWPSLQPSIN
jgi:hypothetical protein